MQLQTYLHLCDAKVGYLVEAYGQEIDYSREEKDEQWFDETVLSPLTKLTERLQDLFKNEQAQAAFFQNSWK
jgi:hypothetical protein